MYRNKKYVKLIKDIFYFINKSFVVLYWYNSWLWSFRSRDPQENIICISDITARLKILGMRVDDSFYGSSLWTYCLLNVGHFILNCNIIKDLWDVNNFTSKIV